MAHLRETALHLLGGVNTLKWRRTARLGVAWRGISVLNALIFVAISAAHRGGTGGTALRPSRRITTRAHL